MATLLLVALAIAQKLDTLPEGLTATYFSDIDWSSTPVHSTIESQPSTEGLVDAWRGSPPPAFSTTWTGSFIVLRAGTYRFATVSDDGSWVYVDGLLVVDNGGPHGAQLATGSVPLERGVHEIFVKYFQGGGLLHFDLSWSRDAAPLEPMPAWALSTRHREFSRVLVSVVIRRSWRAAVWLWFGTLLMVAGAATWPPTRRAVARVIERLREDPARLVLMAVLSGSLVLNLVGIWWGLPSSWVGDELSPKQVFIALSQRFSGGWFDRYPPFHFYVLTVAFSPWVLVKWLGWIHVSDVVEDVMLVVLGRAIGLAAGVGTLMAVYACGARTFGKRAGLFAVAMAGLFSPLVFYSKTANPEMPYVFWFALSLVFYVRLLRTLTLKDAVLFSATATLAICTKDQAYALYLSAPLVIIYHLWRSNRDRGVAHPLREAVLNARLGLAGATAAALFITIHNIPFNLSGFIDHVRYITGLGSKSYRIVEPTLAGRVALLGLTADLLRRSWGWPLLCVSLIGMVVAMTARQSRRVAICLALVMVSYYVGFINVILYNYDRYLLPIGIVQALFGGVALDRLCGLKAAPARAWRVVLVAGVFAYTFLYAATVDVLMIRDSRYTAEHWLRARVGPDDVVGTMFPLVVLPRLDDFQSLDLGTIEDVQRKAPAYYVLNADYARAVAADTPTG